MGGLLNPKTFVEGGGFLEGVTAEVIDAYYGYNDYNGTQEDTPGLYLILDVDGYEDAVTQFWSAGKAGHWTVPKDGSRIAAAKPGKKLTKQSSLGMLMRSLADCGVPEDFFETVDEDPKLFVGMSITFTRERRNENDKKGTPVAEEILSLPGEAVDAAAEAGLILLDILGEKGELKAAALPKLVNPKLKAAGYDADVTKAIKGFLMNMDWIANNPSFAVAKGTITAAV